MSCYQFLLITKLISFTSNTMKGFTLSCVAFLLVLILVPSLTKPLSEEEELKKQQAMKRDIELGILAIEPPEREDPPMFFFPRKPIQAEEDKDHLYHPHHEFPQSFFRPLMMKMEPRQKRNEPEEDRDHLHHAK